MDLNQLNPTQYMWIITKTNKPLALRCEIHMCFHKKKRDKKGVKIRVFTKIVVAP
jgi:hypothetical protein